MTQEIFSLKRYNDTKLVHPIEGKKSQQKNLGATKIFNGNIGGMNMQNRGMKRIKSLRGMKFLLENARMAHF